MSPEPELERLAEAVRQAEAELDAATTRSALNAAAKKLMNARAALRRVQEKSRDSTRPAASREPSRPSAFLTLRGQPLGIVFAATECAACLRAIQRWRVPAEDRHELEARRARD